MNMKIQIKIFCIKFSFTLKKNCYSLSYSNMQQYKELPYTLYIMLYTPVYCLKTIFKQTFSSLSVYRS
jgi:hypothetical protein